MEKQTNILKRGTSWNHLEQAGNTMNELEPPGRNYMEPSGTRWIQQRTDIKIKKFIRTNCAYNIIIQQKQSTVIGNSYCHKEHHLRCLQVKDTLRGILCVQNHQPTGYNFTNNYCHKELHLRCRQGAPDLALIQVYLNKKQNYFHKARDNILQLNIKKLFTELQYYYLRQNDT